MNSKEFKELRKAACRHVVKSWDIYVQSGELDQLQKEYGEMSEQDKKVFQSGWMIGFDCCIMEGKMLFDMIEPHLDEPPDIHGPQ